MNVYCIFLTLLLAQLLTPHSEACTIFASHKGSMPLAGKIRDTKNHHRQELKVVLPDYSLGETESYFGLFAVDGDESITFSPLKMGVNERGVFVGFATVSSVPSQIRRSLPFFKDLTHHLLSRAQTAQEAYELLKQETSPLGLRILIIADAKESYLVENGPDTGTLVKVRSQVATNHYQSRELRHLNTNSLEDSLQRLQLAQRRLPFLDFLTAEDASEVIASLWVPPTTKKSTYTRSDFVVFYPPGQSPFVKVRMEEGGQITQSEFELSTLFAARTCPAQLLTAKMGADFIL